MYLSSLKTFLLLLSIVLFSFESVAQVSDPIANSDDSNSGALVFLTPSFSSLWDSLDPFSFFDFSSASDDRSSVQDDQGDNQSYFIFSFPGINYFSFFWSGPQTEEFEDVSSFEDAPSTLKKSQIPMSCSVCQLFVEEVETYIDYWDSVSEAQFVSRFHENCFEWGISRTNCEFLIDQVVPSIIEWIEEGNDPEAVCDCSDDGDSVSETDKDSDDEDSDDEDSDEDTQDYSALSSRFMITIFGILLLGMILLTIRICLYVKVIRNENFAQEAEDQRSNDRDEEANTPLPAYSELDSIQKGEAEPPKYPFSAQDAAGLFAVNSVPPQYSPLASVHNKIEPSI